MEKPLLTSKKWNRNHLLETVVLDVWQHASWIPSQLSVFRAKVLVWIIIWVFSNSSLRTDFRRKLRTHGLKNTAGSHLQVFPILYRSADFHWNLPCTISTLQATITNPFICTYLTLIWQMNLWFTMEFPLTKKTSFTTWHCSCIRMTAMMTDVSSVSSSSISWYPMPLSSSWTKQQRKAATCMTLQTTQWSRSTILTQVWSFLNWSVSWQSVELTLMRLLRLYPKYVLTQTILSLQRLWKNGQWTTFLM